MKKEEEGNKKNSIGIDPEKYFFPVGNYRLRRAERWEYIPTVSSEVGKIYVSLKDELLINICLVR